MANTANATNTPGAGTSAGKPASAAQQPAAAKAQKPATQTKAAQGATADLGMLRITYVKSVIGYSQRQRDTIRGLGLRRLHQTVEHRATPEIRGMVNKVSHLVRVEEVAE